MTEEQAERIATSALPCPFCGERLAPLHSSYGLQVAHADSPPCPCTGFELYDDADLKAWNTRAAALKG